MGFSQIKWVFLREPILSARADNVVFLSDKLPLSARANNMGFSNLICAPSVFLSVSEHENEGGKAHIICARK